VTTRAAIRVPPGIYYLVLVGVLGSLLYAHASALGGMVALWERSPMYSFGYIVPLVSVFLLWTRREALLGLAPRPALWSGIPVLGVALGLLIGGHLAGVQIAQQIAFVIALFGVALLLFGPPFVRQTWVALVYLLLMVPFWDALTEPLHLPFQKLSATIGVQMLHAVGVPAHHQDVMLYLPNITLEIARACSGVNYVVAVLALGIPLGYLYLPSAWRRVLLIVTAVVVAAFSNSLRVALIGLLSYWNVGSPLHGPFHVLHGLFVSGVGYVVLFAGLRLLTPASPLRPAVPGAPLVRANDHPPLRSFSLRGAVGLMVVYLLVGAFPMSYVSRPVTLARPLDDLPSRLGAWTAGDSLVDGPSWWDGADAVLRRRYAAPGLPTVDVSLAYFAFQRQGKELVGHEGDVLHRGAGVTRMRVGGRGERAEVNVVRLAAGGRDRLAVFWYEVGGRTQASRYRAKWLTLWHTVVSGRSEGMFAAVLTDRPGPGREEATLERLLEFAGRLHDETSTLAGHRP